MASFLAQVEDIVGALPTSADLDDFLTTTAKEIIDIIPPALLLSYVQAVTSVADDNGQAIEGTKILSVSRAGYPAKEVPYAMSAQVIDSASLHMATAMSPVFYRLGKDAFIKPAPDGSNAGQFLLYTYEAFAYTESMSHHLSFPDNCEPALIYGSCIKVLQQKLNVTLHTDEDTEIIAAMQVELATITKSYETQIMILTGGQKK